MQKTISHIVQCSDPAINRTFSNKDDAQAFMNQLAIDYPTAHITGGEMTCYIRLGTHTASKNNDND